MTKTFTQPQPLRDVLYQFSLEKDVPDAELLDEFIKQYPEFAEDLTEFAVQLVFDSMLLKTASIPLPDTHVSPAVSRVLSRFQSALHSAKLSKATTAAAVSLATPVADPFAKLERNEFRQVASSLNANVVFLCKVRDGSIVYGTMPQAFLVLLASALGLPATIVGAYLQARKPVVAAGQFCKADGKPQAGKQVTFEEAVKRSQLTPEQQKYLLNL